MPETIVSLELPAAPPEVDHATSLALLREVAAGTLDRVVRVWRPAPSLALGRLDLRAPGAAAAVAAAARHGFPAVRRLSGGRATLLTAGSLCVGVGEPTAGLGGADGRYRSLSAAVLAALAALGVAAEEGELPGEWCPGAWSVHAGGRKLGGLAQRAVRGAAWTEAVVSATAEGIEAEVAALTEVYAALELPFAPATVGAVGDLAPAPVTHAALAAALLERLGAGGAPPLDAPRAATAAAAERVAGEFALDPGEPRL